MQAQMIPYYSGGPLGQQFNWYERNRKTYHWYLTRFNRLYEHVSSLWYYEGWIPEASVKYAQTHYAAYSVVRPDGLRIISLDTDMCTTFLHFPPDYQ